MRFSLFQIWLPLMLLFGNTLCISVYCQTTFSKTYHLEIGNDNRAQSFFVEDTSFLTITTHDGDMEVISGLTKFTLNGEVIAKESFGDLVLNASRSVVNTNKGFELGGYRWSLDKRLARGLKHIKVNPNLELEFVNEPQLFYKENRSVNKAGILDFNGGLTVLYNSFVQNSGGIDGGAYFGFIDKATDTLVSEYILRGPPDTLYARYDVYDLQSIQDSNLIFIAETRVQSDNSPTGLTSEFEIVKFNKEGEVLKKVVSKANGNNQAIFVDEDNDVYFTDQHTPFYIDSIVTFPDSRSGGLIKLNESLDSVLWSFGISDFDDIGEQRGHTILGITQLEDKNLLAFGEVRLTLEESEKIGFLCKFTKDGEVLWVREYGIPIPEEYVALELIGVLGSGRIEDCKELPDGRILCMGEHAYSIPGTSFYRELWILMLDEDGCLEPGCDATQILTSTHQVETYDEGVIYPNPVSDILHVADVSYDIYKIYDLMGRLVQEGDFTTEIKIPTHLSSGIYVLQLKEDDRLKSIFKFVKE